MENKYNLTEIVPGPKSAPGLTALSGTCAQGREKLAERHADGSSYSPQTEYLIEAARYTDWPFGSLGFPRSTDRGPIGKPSFAYDESWKERKRLSNGIYFEPFPVLNWEGD